MTITSPRTDYDAIRAQNIGGYGTYTHHLGFLGRLYSDRTHFVYELLQNAEDARAEEISFHLHRDRLEVRHDGRSFNSLDVQGICGVGESTKVEDYTQIGKFGIGFKSVYAYTDVPEIHSGTEHFRVEHYVRPYAAATREIPIDTTLFVFPWKKEGVSPAIVFDEISHRLRNLNIQTLLFLRSIAKIAWFVEGEGSGTYEQIEIEPIGGCRRIQVSGSTVSAAGHVQTDKEQWLLFERPVRSTRSEAALRVEVAYKVGEDSANGHRVIVRADSTPLVVSFPTEKETHLGFLIQGPYQTTPARDNIPADVEWNRNLVRETAALIVDTLPELRDAGLLSLGLLDALPIRVANFAPGSMFRPIYDRVRVALRNDALLPTDDGKFVSASNAKLARGAALVDLLSPEQLGQLMGQPHPLYWLDRDITLDRMPGLYRYLVGYRPFMHDEAEAIEPLVEELVLDIEKVCTRLTRPFVEKQSDEWLVSLYSLLSEQRNSLSEQRNTWSIVKSRPILRLQDRWHTAPFDTDGRPMAYLPPPTTTTYPIVHREIAKHPKALEFLERLGLTEPDPTTEIVEQVLPRYECLSDFDEISMRDHHQDITRICGILDRISGPPRELLINRLRDTPFLCAENAHSHAPSFLRPTEIYRKTPDLALYFDGNKEAWFLDEGNSISDSLLAELGVRYSVQLFEQRGDQHGRVVVRSHHGDHMRGLQGFDPRCEIDGLVHALNLRSMEKARFIWNDLLSPNRHMIRGTIETSRNQNYSFSEQEVIFSAIGKVAVAARWLPSQDGTFHQPKDLSPDDLPDGFIRDDELARVLGMRVAELEAAAEASGFSIAELQLLRTHAPEVKALMNRLRDRHSAPAGSEDALEEPETEGDIPVMDFARALEQEFSRPGHTKLTKEAELRDDPIPDVEGRRTREAAAIEADRAKGRLKQHFTKVPRAKWEAKNGATREFLHEEYAGTCQICHQTFPRADGEPYFEGLYLVPRIQAAWLDQPGNVLSLCPTCCAKLQFGAVEAEGLVDQINSIRKLHENGRGQLVLNISLLGADTEIVFTERHMLSLQEMLKARR